MLLRENNLSTQRVFFAAIPLLYLTAELRLKEILLMSVNMTGIFWLSALFFTFFTPFFPARLRQAAYVLWLAVLAQIGFAFFGLPPVWIISLVFLMPAETFDRGKKSQVFLKIFLRGLFFIALLSYMSAFQELLGGRLLLWIFKTPAGALLLLGAAALLWKNQPSLESKTREEEA